MIFKKRSGKNFFGVTLPELLIVITIIGIGAGLAFNKFSASAQRDIRKNTQKTLQTMVAGARSHDIQQPESITNVNLNEDWADHWKENLSSYSALPPETTTPPPGTTSDLLVTGQGRNQVTYYFNLDNTITPPMKRFCARYAFSSDLSLFDCIQWDGVLVEGSDPIPPGGCLVNAQCDLGLCSIDVCNPVTHLCEHTNISCDDGSLCTDDSCVAADGTCAHVPIVCSDGNVCTTDNNCIPASGCQFDPIAGCCTVDGECDDTNVCTGDSCISNSCTNTPIPGCCTADVECDDGDVCTGDSCSSNSCSNTPISNCCTASAECDDGDICTADSCDSNSCTNTPIPNCCEADAECDDGDACTTDSCSSNLCQNIAISGCCPAGEHPSHNHCCPDVDPVSGQWTEWTGTECSACGNGQFDPPEECDVSAPGFDMCIPPFSAMGSINNNTNKSTMGEMTPTPAPDPDGGGGGGGGGGGPVCGNGSLEGSEQCDDGNGVNGDGCSSSCQTEAAICRDCDCTYGIPECGNGQLETGEQCDDDNTVDGDGCSSTCQWEQYCGDGVVQPGLGEICDVGNFDVDPIIPPVQCAQPFKQCIDNCTRCVCIPVLCGQGYQPSPNCGCEPIPCIQDSDCTDSNDCTNDTCGSDNRCVYDPTGTEGQACDSGDLCWPGVCGSAPDLGLCFETPLDCDDGLFCNGTETCDSGIGCVSSSNPCPVANPLEPICVEPWNDQCKQCTDDSFLTQTVSSQCDALFPNPSHNKYCLSIGEGSPEDSLGIPNEYTCVECIVSGDCGWLSCANPLLPTCDGFGGAATFTCICGSGG